MNVGDYVEIISGYWTGLKGHIVSKLNGQVDIDIGGNCIVKCLNQMVAVTQPGTQPAAPSPTGYPYQLPLPTNTSQPSGPTGTAALLGWTPEIPEVKSCTCGESATGKSKNHWADCALVTSK